MTPTLEAVKLAPCPFCGSPRVEWDYDDHAYGEHIQCEDCCASVYGTKEVSAEQAWNRRAAPALLERIAALEGDAARYRWLREHGAAGSGNPFICLYRNGAFSQWTGERADEMVDAAIALLSPDAALDAARVGG